MSRSVKLAVAAGFGGLLAALAALSATRPPAIHETTIHVEDETAPPDRRAAELRRCAAIILPESGCDAIWEAERRRFFHGRKPAP